MQVPILTLIEQEEIADDLLPASQLIGGIDQVRSAWRLEISTSSNWPQVKLSEIIVDSMYGSSQKADYGDSGYPMLRIGNIGFCDFDLSDIKRVELTTSDFRKFRLEDGDFLIVRSNGNPGLVGKCAVWNGAGDHVFASYLIRFRFDRAQVDPRYVMFYLMSKGGRALLNPTAGGGTYNISATTFQNVKIPLPSLGEQHRIVADLDKKLALQSELLSMRFESQKRIQSMLGRVWES